MKTHLILGPNRELKEIQELKESYSKAGNNLSIYGDGINYLACKVIKLSNHDRVIIEADGALNKNDHFLDLCSLQKTDATIKKLFSNKIVHIELISCHGGAGINAIDKLAAGSTLITLTDKKDPLSGSLIHEVHLQTLNTSETNNPFVQFAYYLMLNPDHNQFAVKTNTGTKIFSSSVKALNKYSIIDIKDWQKKQLQAFSKFCNEIKSDFDKENQQYVLQILSLLGNKEQILDSFDALRYRELLLINMARNDDTGAIEAILKTGINVDSSLKDSATAISLAAKFGNIEVIELLLNYGAQIDGVGSKIFPLYSAALEKNIDVINYLLNKGANIDRQEENGASALSKAAEEGNSDIAKFLLNKGASVDIVDNLGNTPFIIAASKGYLEIVQVLYNKKADINKVNDNKQSAIYLAAAKGYTDIVEFLCSKNINVNSQNLDGTTPIIVASQEQKADIVKILVKANANLEITSKGINALNFAGLLKNIEIVKILLSAGADTKVKYQDKTLLEWNPSKEITSEIKKFDKDPVKYILQHNEQAKFALNSLNNVEHHSQVISNLLDKIHQTEECLEVQNQEMILDLNSLCGENGSWYQTEL